GIAVPRGRAARSPDEAAQIAQDLGGATVIKVQSGTTGRAAAGGVAFADSPREVREHAARMLALHFGQFPVEQVLVEERLQIARELFVSLTIDDQARAPVLLFSATGGSGIEDRADSAVRLPCDVEQGPDPVDVRRAVEAAEVSSKVVSSMVQTITQVFQIAQHMDARNVEINPLVITDDGRVMAADCRMTIDDYAVFRHPELHIDIAREFDHPPTTLERIAYSVEEADHRGTFYFAQLSSRAPEGSRGLVGFHGAGGGGSMMAMDAITNEGFTIANFTDTSGNPSAAKVYRAARIILAQPGLVGYFGSGSGVASQEQFWSAYGLAKAFLELQLDIPAVIRLGGNTEDRAVEILSSVGRMLPATVEGYRKTDTPAFVARRFAELVAERRGRPWIPREPTIPSFVNSPSAASFPIKGGRLWIDTAAWANQKHVILANSGKLIRNEHERPALAVDPQEFATKDSELIACEIECRLTGCDGLWLELDIQNLVPNA
ncbi:MAG TPA: ATP-grasp domain-containing protein, partial [Pirellulaceae bacterium]